jgi:transposase
MQGQVLPERSTMAPVYAGIDVCKDWLDVYLHPIGQSLRVANTRDGILRLKRRIAQHSVIRIVMEATGKYHRLAHRTLHAGGFAVAIVNPLRARLFAEAIGALAKTDRLDARTLALLAASLTPCASPPAPKMLEELQELVRARAAAIADRTALTNQIGQAQTAFLKCELRRRCAATARAINRLDAEIKRRIAAVPILARRCEIISSIAGAGFVAAVTIAVELDEIGTCSGKAAAMLAGLAPVAHDSGEKSGQRHIRGGRAAVRTGLYMAALTAARCNPDLKAFYKRLRAKGKAFKVAITAVMRKLLVLANTLITQDRLWTHIHA